MTRDYHRACSTTHRSALPCSTESQPRGLCKNGKSLCQFRQILPVLTQRLSARIPSRERPSVFHGNVNFHLAHQSLVWKRNCTQVGVCYVTRADPFHSIV